MTKKPKTPLGRWKTIRVRRKALDTLREVMKANPCPQSFVPYTDVETLNDSAVFDIAGWLAVLQISGQLFQDLQPKLEGQIRMAQENGAAQVAAHFGATVRKEKNGTYTIVKTRGREIPLPRLPATNLPAEMFLPRTTGPGSPNSSIN